MEKFQNKYRIPSARLQNWDYGSPGMYFITICTKNREHYFGKIGRATVETQCVSTVETQCVASLRATEIGIIAEQEWLKTPQLRPDMNLELGEFVIMPNHIHGIIIIGENRGGRSRDAMHGVSTTTPADPITTTPADPITTTPADPITTTPADHTKSTKNQFGPQSKNIGSIIRGFKSSVTTFARKNKMEFGWQERFHDHIIRNQKEYLRISRYIINNPGNWKEDKFH